MAKRNGAPRLLNAMMVALTRCGLSPMGAQELTVTGRRSGAPRTAPVNPLAHHGALYLVAARGETQWVRNVRQAPEVSLRLGRRVTSYRAVEAQGPAKVSVLQAYLRKWRWEVGTFFPGLTANASADQVAAVADAHPVFRLEAIAPTGDGTTDEPDEVAVP